MNTVNWALWLLLSMAFSAMTYHPAYQLILLLAICAVAAYSKQSFNSFLRMGLAISAIPLLINVFMVHMGKTVLLEVPRNLAVLGMDIPTLMLAGPITAESILMGVIMALFLTNMICAFQVFNTSSAPDSVLALIPAWMPGVGLASSVALRFMPSVMRDHASITDAQRSRGLRINSGGVKTRINSQLSILAPTVMTSLERGFSLAESMAARGYSKSRTRYNPEKWTLKEKTQTCVFLAALVLTLCSKYAGQLEYWPYSSLVSQPLSYPPMLALFSILTPLTDHE